LKKEKEILAHIDAIWEETEVVFIDAAIKR